MNQMVELMILVLVVLIAMGAVFNFGFPVLEGAKTGSFLQEGEEILSKLNYLIKEVSEEGKGSSRVFSFQSQLSGFKVMPEENVVSLEREVTGDNFPYGIKEKEGNMISYNGGSVGCYYEEDKIILENRILRFELNNFNDTYNNKDIISSVRNKVSGDSWTDLDVPLLVNENNQSNQGSGKSVILNPGKGKPKCMVKYSMNSTVEYDIFVSLTTGSDFISYKVRNLR